MKRIRLFVLIAVIFGFMKLAVAQTPVEVYTDGEAVSNTNPLPISGSMTLSGGALETTQLLIKGLLQGLSDNTVTETQAAQILTQLLKFTFTGTDLKTVFSNTTIGATQSGIWNIGEITTLPNVTIGTFPDNEPFNFAQYGGSAVGADNGVYVRAGTGVLFYPLDYSDATHQESGNVLLEDVKTNTNPLVASGGGGYVRQDSTATIAKETGGNLADVKTNTDSYTYTPVFATSTCSDTSVWYAYSIPANTVGIKITAREGYDWKISKDSNGATYELIWAGDSFSIPQVRNTTITGTVYINSPDKTGLVMQIRLLTKE